jgi:hypothetical protein
MTYRPDVQTRRAILEATRDQYRVDGFKAEVTKVAVGAQRARNADEEKQLKASIADFDHSAECAYAAARALDEEIAKLSPDEGANAAT